MRSPGLALLPLPDYPSHLKETPVRRYLPLFATLISLSPFAKSQAVARPASPKPTPDVLIFENGDQLTGKLERVAAGNIVFASDMAGEVTISVDKVKELKSGAQFALLRKGEKVGKGKTPAPEGTIAVVDGKLTVTPVVDPAVTLPAKEVAYLVDQKTFDKELNHKAKWYEGWTGQASGGATLVRATTTETTLTAGLNLLRALPGVPWMPARNRTTVNVNESYGKNTTPGAIPQPAPPAKPIPDVTTLSSIFHADAERDEYFSPRFYYLGELSFDHNYSQSLQLQQIYGAGVGWTAIKRARQQLDLKVAAQYESQHFFDATAGVNQNLIGATIGANYLLTIRKGITFTQQLDFVPAFNNPHAFSATETDALNFPAYKNFSFTVGSLDSYLNNIPTTEPPTQRNSFQFTIGATYAIKSKY